MTARVAPDWPRNMRRQTAAAYLDMAVAEFDRQIASGHLPLPFKLGKHEYWSRVKIDEHMAALDGSAPEVRDWRKGHPLYA